MRRVLIVAVLLFGLSAAPAHAAPPAGVSLPESLTTEHFDIHFTGAIGVHATIRQYVGEFAATAEWAHDTYRSWGYPAYIDEGDGDSRIEVYIYDFATVHTTVADVANLVAFATPLGAGQAAGQIDVNVKFIRDPQVAAHQAFHMLQMAMYSQARDWLAQATAEWAAFRLRSYPIPTVTPAPPVFHEPDNSLDCDPASTSWPGKWAQRACGLTGYEAAGYTRWTFFQYLQERFGADIVKDVWTRVQAQASPLYDGDDAIRDALAAKDKALTDIFNDYTLAILTGNFETTLLKNVTPVLYATVETPESGGVIKEQRVAVNRLASRFVALAPPTQTDRECYEATLSLTVTLPVGVSSRPYVFATKTKTATALSVSGTTATTSIPWDTCSSDFPAYVSFPNSSQSLDGRMFVLNGSVTVDKTKVMTKTPPPAAAVVTGTIIAAPTEDPAPTIFLYAPEVLRIAADARVLRLVVFATGAGRIRATFNGANLGTSSVRAGANDLRFKLPSRAARLVLARQSVLELTALSPAGSPGTTFVQKIAFQKAKPKKRR